MQNSLLILRGREGIFRTMEIIPAMQAIVCHELTGPAALRLEEVPEPRPGPGQVRIRVRACGVNFADSLITRGQYQKQPAPPFSPGFEVSGEVLELGTGVGGIAIGDRVIAMTPHGGYAEQVIADIERCVPMPAAMSWEHGAAFPVVFGTSHVALWHRARLRAGETLVVHGASGGVGLTAVAIGKQLGATVIATANGPEKLQVAREHGADHLIDSSHEDLRTRIREFTDGRGADVVYDPVGGELFTASLRSIAFEGRILIIGFAGGSRAADSRQSSAGQECGRDRCQLAGLCGIESAGDDREFPDTDAMVSGRRDQAACLGDLSAGSRRSRRSIRW
jgi:NADPH2:quinone reductase